MNISAKNISSSISKSFLVVSLIFISFTTFSQPCPPEAPDGTPGCGGGDPSLPLDGGASLLIAAGVGLIGKKALQYRKSLKSEAND